MSTPPKPIPSSATPAGAAYRERKSLRERALADAIAQTTKSRELVTFADRDLAFEVRPMRAGPATRLMSEGLKTTTQAAIGGKVTTTAEVDVPLYLPRLIAFSTYDPDAGDDAEPLWPADEQGFAEINRLAPDVFDGLATVAMRLNGLTTGAREALGEGSAETPAGSPSSDSPSVSAA